MTDGKKGGRQRSTSWDDLGWTTLPNGTEVSRFRLGSEDDPSAPAVFLARFPPGCTIEPHGHDTDYAEIILEGSQQVTGRWHRAGDIRIVRAGTGYGPLVTGPDGATVVVIFKDSRWQPVDLKTGSGDPYAEQLADLFD